ncbi:MAG: carboxypeptidase-like regulatory domain-containing protein, partial [Acidobacteriota bacterium]
MIARVPAMASLTSLAILAMAMTTAAQGPVRDARVQDPVRDAPPQSDAAVISGVVTIDVPAGVQGTPQPARRVRVTLAPQDASNAAGRDDFAAGLGPFSTSPGFPGFAPTPATPAAAAAVATGTAPGGLVTIRPGGGSRSVLTDDTGGFSFVDVRAGRYTLEATKPGYLRVAYGARRYDRPGTPIAVVNGQRLTVTMKMTRGGVIAGTLQDALGTPAVNVGIRAVQVKQQPNGQRLFVPLGRQSVQVVDRTETDDRGAYRLFGLPAGDYLVVAAPRLPAGAREAQAMSDSEIDSALAALQLPARTPAASDRLPAAEPATVGYSQIYFPGTTQPGMATAVTVAQGDERTGVDFQLRLVPTAKIEGMVLTPADVAPQSVQITLLPLDSNIGAIGLPGQLNRAAVGADGRFSYSGITPGRYTISARMQSSQVFMQDGGSMMVFRTLD